MGQACTLSDPLQQFSHPVIEVSKEFFIQTQPNEEIFNKCKSLLLEEIAFDFQNSKYYCKNSNIWMIGSIQQSGASNIGILFTPEKSLYYGNFHHGLMAGNGMLHVLTEKIIYKGQFKRGKPDGKGTLLNENQKFSFTGIWKQSGHSSKSTPVSGILKLKSHKNIEQIQFECFQPKKVSIYYKNGSIYSGFIDKSTLLPTGSGKITYQLGDIYDGEWLNGKFQGTGTYVWKHGQRYRGQYFQGLKNGQGTFEYKDRKYFIGYWKNGVRDGLGKVIDQKGSILQRGIYVKDKFDFEQTDAYMNGFMQKARQQEVKSQLMQNSDKNQQSANKNNFLRIDNIKQAN